MATAEHRFISQGLGLLGFPHGTEASPADGMGDHIMGVVVLAWLCEYPVAQWGARWARSGSIEARFRAHAVSGAPITATARTTERETTLSLAGADGTVLATGSASIDDTNTNTNTDTNTDTNTRADTVGALLPIANRALLPEPDDLLGRTLAPIEFGFEAERDLAFTQHLERGSFWRERRWAHPAWLASGANAIVKRNVAFRPPGRWHHTGIEVRTIAPIETGAVVTLSGHVEQVFDRRRHRFAVCLLDASVDERKVAVLRKTFAYAEAPSVTPTRGSEGPDGSECAGTATLPV